jgi:hypothetical protein
MVENKGEAKKHIERFLVNLVPGVVIAREISPKLLDSGFKQMICLADLWNNVTIAFGVCGLVLGKVASEHFAEAAVVYIAERVAIALIGTGWQNERDAKK